MGKMYTRKVKCNGRNYEIRVEQYGGTSELQHDLEKRERKGGGFHAPEFSEWTGVKDEAELKDYLINGYDPTVQKLKDHVKINASGNGKRIKFQNNVQGFAPVVPLAMMNVPNNMIDMWMKPIKNKVIDVYYDMTCSCGVSSSQIIDSGEKVLGAIMELEHQGYKFNLYSIQTYSDSKDCDMMIVKIKSSDKPFDLKRMSFPLMHTGFFRVVGFDWYSKCPQSRYRGGYGHNISREFDKAELDQITKDMFGQQALLFRADSIVSKKMSQDHIKEVLLNGERKN